ncbi:hypothetical protein D3C78_1953400 [compost metagenome]
MAVAEAAYQNPRFISSVGAGAEEVGADADMHSERGPGLHQGRHRGTAQRIFAALA